jgi:hypothetical protein
MPNARNALELVQYVTTVVEPDPFYLSNLAGVVKLIQIQLMVKLPRRKKILKRRTTPDLYRGAFRKFFFVNAFRCFHYHLFEYVVVTYL